MTHAAKAVYKAQDRMHEIQPDYPFSNAEQPDTSSSSFPRSLFGKARAAVNGALAGPSTADSLQRAASDDVRSSVSAVERTESGVSAADSVESFSSVRSNASGGNLAIALVASGNKNGYEGGLHHVVIPETEAVAGPPPPEKLGAPLVEGRFLPNMHPHSHILQQPHIRAVRDLHMLISDDLLHSSALPVNADLVCSQLEFELKHQLSTASLSSHLQGNSQGLLLGFSMSKSLSSASSARCLIGAGRTVEIFKRRKASLLS
jgi:hypothetical protein